jgi:hypothetical protein
MCPSPGEIIDDALDIIEDAVDIIIDVVETVVDAAVDIFESALSIVGMPFGLDMGAPAVEQAQAQAIQGVLVNKDTAVNPVPVVYGTRRVGGSRVFISTDGTNNKYLYVALVLSEGQVNGYTKLFLDDNEVPLSSYAHGVVATPSSGPYTDRLQAQFFDGRDTQTQSSVLGQTPNWTSQHTLSGLSYIACRFEWKKIETQEDADNNPYRGLPKINVLLQGRKIKDATSLSAGHSTAYGSETTTFTNNPVSVLLDYMRNPRYGKGLPNDSFDFTSFKVAADLCDQTVQYTSSTTGKAFTTDAVVDTGQTLMNNVKVLLSPMRGIMPYQVGQYHLKIEHGGDDTDIAATPTDPSTSFTITTDHIVGGVALQAPSKKNKLNRAVLTFVDPDADYQAEQVVYPEDGSADDIAFLAEDGIRLEKKFTFNMITNREQALQMAEVMVKKSRANQTISLQTTTDTATISVGDLVRITNANISLDGIFRVQSVDLTAQGQIGFTGTQHNASDYAINAKSIAPAKPTINLPDPLQVDAVSNLTITSGATLNLTDSDGNTTRRMKASWTASTDPFVVNYIVQYKKSSDTTFFTIVETSDTQVLISPVALGETYDVRVRARNELNRVSNFNTALNHTVAETFTSNSGSLSSGTTPTTSSSKTTIGASQLGA